MFVPHGGANGSAVEALLTVGKGGIAVGPADGVVQTRKHAAKAFPFLKITLNGVEHGANFLS